MSNTPFYINLAEQVLSYKNQSFYDLVQQQCGDVVVEIMQLQDISSVECLLEVGDIFAFLNLDSNELIQIKKKAGIFLNNGSYVLKTGILYKVQTFINILNELSRKHVNYSDRQSSNESCNLTVPEELVEKLPFIRTLITYSSLVVNSKADFTLLNILLSNMFRNLGIADKGFRYESIVRQFATALYVLGGRSAYEFLRLNIPGLLPSVQILQAAISATENNLTEGKFNYEGACNYFNSIQATLGFIAEDATAVIPKITYDTTSDTFVGFALPLDNCGLPINNTYSTKSFNIFEEWCSNTPKAKLLTAHLIQPLSHSSSPSPYLFSAYGTDNKYKSIDVLSRWHRIYQEYKANGIRILGFSTDCDSRYLQAMRASLGFFAQFAYQDHPDLLNIDIPRSWSWFFIQSEQLYICFQDPIHICTKLRNRLLSETATLLLGNQLINMDPLMDLINNYSKLDHGLVCSDVNPKDRQNYNSAAKISNDNILILLKNITNSFGLNIYLQAIQSVRLAYIDKNTDIIERIYYAWVSVFIFRSWLVWIDSKDKKDLDLIISQLLNLDLNDTKKKYQVKRQYFITYQSYFCVEINAHSLIYLATLVCEGKLPFEALNISLQNSQTCEGMFRSARAISSITSAGVNFTILQFLKRANKLRALQNIKNSSHENHLRFPQHHKLAKTNQVTSTGQDKNALSKKSIENAVLKAYKYVSNLFSQMNLKALLRKGQFISIDEMSNIVLSSLDDFWSSDLGTINSETGSNEIDSENEINNEDQSNVVYDSDEEFELNDHLNVSDDINVSSYQGIRLFDNVKQELAHSYFKVSVNNENKYLNKQAACWILEKDKTSLSSNRLSRVQGR